MKLLNYGSMNFDYTYQVDHMVRPKETLSSRGRSVYCGGKGFNQSIALARAGVEVWHAGMIGEDGDRFLEEFAANGVDKSLVRKQDGASGHAIIQVTPEGENCILLYKGANWMNSPEQLEEVFSHFAEGDWLLLQNEINLLSEMIDAAYSRGMKIILNPSPYNEEIAKCDLQKVSMFLVNEVEGVQMTGKENPEKILDAFERGYPQCEVVLTLGENGVVYSGHGTRIAASAYSVPIVDTTAAGDTFTGYFLAALLSGSDTETALRTGCAASALAIQKSGAASSIPKRAEVEAFLKENGLG